MNSRREFLGTAVALSLCSVMGRASERRLRIGVTDWCLNMAANPDAVRLAATLGFDALQISFGQELVGGKLSADNPEVIATYLNLSRKYGIDIDGTSLDQRHSLDQRWVLDSIRITRALGASVLELPFFGTSAIKTKRDIEYVGDVLRELAPEASEAKVILGLENTLSAENNALLIERSQSKNVQVYYDVGNATAAGFDPVREIRWLGRDRICQFHFKDEPHLIGAGNIRFLSVLRVMRDIDFDGYANLETGSPSGNLGADMQKNLTYIRKIMPEVIN